MNLFDFVVGAFALSTLTLGGLAILKLFPRSAWWSSWPAQIALAHLVAAAVMAWVVTVVGLASKRLSVLPVYLLFIVIAAVAWRRKQTARIGSNTVLAGPSIRLVEVVCDLRHLRRLSGSRIGFDL